MKKLEVAQRKFLRRMLGVKNGTANSFLHLELGVLPIAYEIHKRQLSFLYHIVHLDEDDPVKKVWKNQQALPDYPNWWNDIKKLIVTYSLDKMSEKEIQSMSKLSYKKKIKDAVHKKAFEDLCQEVKLKSRTKDIVYNEFATQDYIKKLYPNQSRIVFQCRSKASRIKEHADYQHKDNFCRWCGVSDETLVHVVNCGVHGERIENVEQTLVLCNDNLKLSLIADRVEDFISRVEI